MPLGTNCDLWHNTDKLSSYACIHTVLCYIDMHKIKANLRGQKEEKNPSTAYCYGKRFVQLFYYLIFCSRSRPGGRSENLGGKKKLKTFCRKMFCLLPPHPPQVPPAPRLSNSLTVWSLTVAVIQCLNYSLICKTAVCTYKLWQSN